jgi:hypothetical protein
VNIFHFSRAQKERVEKDKREKAEAHLRKKEHADEVRKQIREKDQMKVAERNAFFEEGVKLDVEAKQRRQKLDEIKAKKLEELRLVSYLLLLLCNNFYLLSKLCTFLYLPVNLNFFYHRKV